MALKIKIIVGSTRPNRFGPQPAHWFFELAKKRTDAQFELVDLKDVNLPLLDEGVPPSAKQPFSQEHTKKWAAIVSEADGFVFVTPEYNHSIGAALKNAIDYLFYEWHFKPVGFVSYGGGAGGGRAVEHLRGVAAEVRLYGIREQVLLTNYWNTMDEKGQFKFTNDHVTAANALLDQLLFWTGQFQRSRQDLAKLQK